MSELQPINLLSLPDELLVKILELLPLTVIETVRQTCSKLYEISQSREILKKQKFIFTFVDINKDEEKLNRIIEMDLSYLNLELNTYSSKQDRNDIDTVISKMIRFLGPKIRSFSLNFFYDHLSFTLLEDILLTCVSLKELYLYSIKFKELESTRIKPKDINTKLEILKLNRCYFSSSCIIDLILNFYPAIRTFQLNPFMKEGNEKELELFDECVVRKIITYNKSLQDLDLRAVNKYRGFIKSTFIKLASAKLKLRNICLKYEENISKDEFKILFSNHNNLKQLILKDCDAFDAKCLRNLVTDCPTLERLYLRSSNDPRLGKYMTNDFNAECFHNLLTYHPKLEHLSLRARYHVFHFPHGLKIKPQMGINLKVLVFQNVRFYGGNTRALNFPNLEHFKLKQCKTRDEINYFEFLNNCHLKYLTIRMCELHGIDIARIISVSQDTLITLKLQGMMCTATISNAHFSKLEKLFIYGQFKALTILQNAYFPCLKKLDIFSHEANQECQIIMKNCPFLESLFLMAKEMEKLDEQTILDLRTLRFLKSFQRQDYSGSKEIVFPKQSK